MSGRIRAGVFLTAAAVLLAACGAAAGSDDTAPPEDAAAEQDAVEASGDPAPDVEFENFDGEVRTISDLQGQPVVLNFWASWCPPCVAEMPYIESVHQDLGDEIQFLGMNTQDSMGPALDLVDETGVTYELGLDPNGDIFRTFSVFTMPMTFFINADGEVVDTHGGIFTEQQLRDQIRDNFGVS